MGLVNFSTCRRVVFDLHRGLLPGLSRGKLLDLQVRLLVPATERLDQHGDEDDASIHTGLPIMGHFPVEGHICSVNLTFSYGNV